MTKRIVSALVSALILFCLCSSSLYVFARDITDNKEDASEIFEDALGFSCRYNAEEKKITVEGTMNYEAFAKHKESKLIIYAIPPGASESDVAANPDAKILAETDASIRFGFSFNLNNTLDRFSRYAIFLRSPEGVLTLGTEAQYPEVAYVKGDMDSQSCFKGIFGYPTAKYSELNAGTAILPVYLDELFTDISAGYIHQVDDEQFFFAKNYIDRLDASVNSLSASGAKVYLQFLLKSNGTFTIQKTETTSYYLPDVYDSTALKLINAATEFLTARYKETRGGNISGIVVGKGWDDYYTNNYSNLTDLEKYAQKCAFYAMVVANSARSISPNLDIVLPFTGNNFKDDSSFAGEEGRSFATKKLIEFIMAYFDDSFESGMPCSLLIESEEVPLGISNESLEDGIDVEAHQPFDALCAGSQRKLVDFLKVLSGKYKSVPQSFIFVWRPPSSLRGNALTAAYAYSYYSLLKDNAVASFVIDLSDFDKGRIKDISRIIKYIDTPRSGEITQSLLKYFGRASWSEVVGGEVPSVGGGKQILSISAMQSLPENCKGSFGYFSFSDYSAIEGWYKGIGCTGLKMDYASSEKRALKADLTTADGASAEVIYEYEYYENIEFTPYLAFDLQVSDGAEDSIYEISFMFENSDMRLESSYAVRGNEKCRVVLDLSQSREFKLLENMRISVRQIYGDASNSTLWLHGISGYSTEYEEERLEELILNERNKIKNIDEESSEAAGIEQTAIAIGIVVVLGALGIGIFIAFRKDTKSNKND